MNRNNPKNFGKRGTRQMRRLTMRGLIATTIAISTISIFAGPNPALAQFDSSFDSSDIVEIRWNGLQGTYHATVQYVCLEKQSLPDAYRDFDLYAGVADKAYPLSDAATVVNLQRGSSVLVTTGECLPQIREQVASTGVNLEEYSVIRVGDAPASASSGSGIEQKPAASQVEATSSGAATGDADLVDIRWKGIARGPVSRVYKVCLPEEDTPVIERYLATVGVKSNGVGYNQNQVATAGAGAAAIRLARYHEGLVLVTTEDCLPTILTTLRQARRERHRHELDMSDFIVRSVGADGRLYSRGAPNGDRATSRKDVEISQQSESAISDNNSTLPDPDGNVELVSQDLANNYEDYARQGRLPIIRICADADATIRAYGGDENFERPVNTRGLHFSLMNPDMDLRIEGSGPTIKGRRSIYVTNQKCLPEIVDSMRKAGLDRGDYLIRAASPTNWGK